MGGGCVWCVGIYGIISDSHSIRVLIQNRLQIVDYVDEWAELFMRSSKLIQQNILIHPCGLIQFITAVKENKKISHDVR